MRNEPVNGPFSSITELIQRQSRPVQYLTVLFGSGLAAYFATHAVLVSLGEPYSVLIDPFGIGVTVGFLMIAGAIGLLVRRPLLVGAVFCAIGLAYVVPGAVRGTGAAMPWVRQVLFYLLPFLISGALLQRWHLASRPASANGS